ncbi:siroheme synthase CysG [Marinicellulosiphila megalodicopiae]|uniref:siroheme synthase CysG n=1 Tax=Marinicellulosiphila megalodicopiae TaxID=2724896 RepID=UPI003BB0FE41
MSQSYIPLSISLTRQPCLVIGAGNIASSRVEKLVEAGAVVTVIASNIDARIEQMRDVEIIKQPYASMDLSKYKLVVIATDNDEANQTALKDAQRGGCLINSAFDGLQGDVIFPAIIKRGLFQLALTSQGVTPTLTRLLRGWLEARIPFGVSNLAQFASENAGTIKKRFKTEQRKYFWQSLFHGIAGQKLMDGDQLSLSEVDDLIEKADEYKHKGEVYLVGAGPGDPELLTFKALRLIQQSQVVLYDRLVSQEILNMIPADAKKINVGKERDMHLVPQGDINQLLADEAKKGQRVLRLKGGDPFIFGRGGEEIELLFDQGVPFQVVPGITAGAGCSSYAGIPLTHRDYSQSVRFITGHLKNGTSDLPWHEYQYGNQTLVFYMGLKSLRIICEQLILAGKPKQTPIALIQKGTTKDQKVWTGTLETMADDIQNEKIQAPTLIIIGEVVKLREKLAWRG